VPDDIKEEYPLLKYKYFYIITFSILLIPMLFKRKLTELSFASYLQFSGIFLLLLIFILKLANNDVTVKPDNEVIESISITHLITCSNIIFTAYGYIITLFPIY
jgi:amino acid permease